MEQQFKKSCFNYETCTNTGYILYNTLYNGLIRLDEVEYQQYVTLQFTNSELCSDLSEQGFLVDANMEEEALYRFFAKTMHKFSHHSPNITLTPTMACNARCFYCFEEGACHATMSKETATDLVSWIETLDTEQGVDMTWFGGEPLLNPKLIDFIANQLKEKSIPFSSYLVTNGSLLNPQEIDDQISRWNLYHVQITLDGDESEYLKRKQYADGATHYYDTVLTNIRTLAQKPLHIHLRLNIDRENVESVYRLGKDLEQIFAKYPNVTFYPAFLTGLKQPLSDKEKVDILKKLFSQTRNTEKASANHLLYSSPKFSACHYNDPMAYSVDAEGRVFICEHHLGRYSLAIGTLTAPPSPQDNQREGAGTREECQGCVFLPKCFGGCNSKLSSGETACFEAKYIIMAYLELL